MSTNFCIFSGNVGRDPELAYTPSGMAVCKTSLAVAQWKKQGKEVPPMWKNLVLFGKTAENFSEWIHKGDSILVTGREVEDTYVDKEGKTQRWLTLNVSSFEILKRAAVPFSTIGEIDESLDYDERPF